MRKLKVNRAKCNLTHPRTMISFLVRENYGTYNILGYHANGGVNPIAVGYA